MNKQAKKILSFYNKHFFMNPKITEALKYGNIWGINFFNAAKPHQLISINVGKNCCFEKGKLEQYIREGNSNELKQLNLRKRILIVNDGTLLFINS